jgi:hypothetical protein
MASVMLFTIDLFLLYRLYGELTHHLDQHITSDHGALQHDFYESITNALNLPILEKLRTWNSSGSHKDGMAKRLYGARRLSTAAIGLDYTDLIPC